MMGDDETTVHAAGARFLSTSRYRLRGAELLSDPPCLRLHVEWGPPDAPVAGAIYLPDTPELRRALPPPGAALQIGVFVAEEVPRAEEEEPAAPPPPQQPRRGLVARRGRGH